VWKEAQQRPEGSNYSGHAAGDDATKQEQILTASILWVCQIAQWSSQQHCSAGTIKKHAAGQLTCWQTDEECQRKEEDGQKQHGAKDLEALLVPHPQDLLWHLRFHRLLHALEAELRHSLCTEGRESLLLNVEPR